MERSIGLEFTMEAADENRCKECTAGYDYDAGVYRPIVGKYCKNCIRDYFVLHECADTRICTTKCYAQVSLAPREWKASDPPNTSGDAKRCSCNKFFCTQCSKHKSIIHVSCCNYVFCGKKLEKIDETLVVQDRNTLLRSRPLRVRCVPYLCGWCQKCIECLRLDKYNKCRYKQCAGIDCDEQICQLCCEEVFRTELRFCKACLKENGETHLLAVAQTLVPDAPAVGDIANDYAARGAIHFGSGVGSDSD